MSAPTPPGPRGSWLLGSYRDFRRDILGFLTRCTREYGDVSSFRLGSRRLVLVNHPDLVHQVLVTDNQKFVRPFNYDLLRAFLGNGLLTNDGPPWLKQRRSIQPLFLRQRLVGYVEPAVRLVERYVAGWKAGDRRDLHTDLMRLALQIVSQVILGVDTDEDAGAVEVALDALLDDFKFRFETGITLPYWVPTPGNLRARAAVRTLKRIIGGMIARRRARPEARDDMLTRLLAVRDEDGAAMSDQQLYDELVTMLLAGHETTANTLTWAFDQLARNPAVEQQLVDEMHAVGGPLTADHLDRLKATERVVLEAMRLFPTAYLLGRLSTEPVRLGGYEFPAGTTVMMSQWVLQRDGRFFEEPEAFRPDRWLSGPRGLPGRAYFPFGGGPRLCVGSLFAMMEATLVLGTLVPRFRFRLESEERAVPWPSVTLRPRDGLRVVVEERTPAATRTPAPVARVS